MKNDEVVIECRKCERFLFIEEITKEKFQEIMEMDCPYCGEEGHRNWILVRMGNYEEEYYEKEYREEK